MVPMPSACWTGEPLFSFSDDGPRPHVLIYAAQPDAHSSAHQLLLPAGSAWPR
jgi:hypothetical protein